MKFTHTPSTVSEDPFSEQTLVLTEDHINDRYSSSQYDPSGYYDGVEGMIKWCEDLVYIPIYPEGEDVAVWVRMGLLPKEVHPRTGKSYDNIWVNQKKVLRRALEMRDNRTRFKYNLIVFCWPRGEGKSLLAVLVQLWKFFNWNRQVITLGANSKDQTKFVHYDLMRDIIINSPVLYRQVGRRNIQEKEIRLVGSRGEIVNLIRTISTASGIVSNITGFTFSEMFDMKNPKFYTQLYGSIRNVPNALGVIDSTISEKSHILYTLFQNYQKKKTRKLFFSYRNAPMGVSDEYWNPNMDEDQLNDYRENFPFGEFERYYQNNWEAGRKRVFTELQIREMGYIGINGMLFNHAEVKEALEEVEKYETQKVFLEEKGYFQDLERLENQVKVVENDLWTVDHVYGKRNQYHLNEFPSAEVLVRLGDLLETDWGILVGADLSDPLSIRSNARSIVSVVAKGLVGSRKTPEINQLAAPRYIYLLLYMLNLENHSLDSLKEVLELLSEEYEGVDTFCMERWGMGDMNIWCEDRHIFNEFIFPSYARQRESFKELFTVVDQGRFKAPSIPITGSKKDDVLREELSLFDHDPVKKWFGSPEKSEKYGVQDDSVYSVSWAIYGGRYITPYDFRKIKGVVNFGHMQENKDMLGRY